jgi:phosphomevalonate kinase
VVYQPSINAGAPVAAPVPSQQQAVYMHVPLINSSYIAERAPSEVSPAVVDESKVVFAKLAKRLKCTSVLQLVIGGLTISTALWSSFTARRHAEKIIAKHPLVQNATDVNQ